MALAHRIARIQQAVDHFGRAKRDREAHRAEERLVYEHLEAGRLPVRKGLNVLDLNFLGGLGHEGPVGVGPFHKILNGVQVVEGRGKRQEVQARLFRELRLGLVVAPAHAALDAFHGGRSHAHARGAAAAAAGAGYVLCRPAGLLVLVLVVVGSEELQVEATGAVHGAGKPDRKHLEKAREEQVSFVEEALDLLSSHAVQHRHDLGPVVLVRKGAPRRRELGNVAGIHPHRREVLVVHDEHR